jgi:hypothetical protein
MHCFIQQELETADIEMQYVSEKTKMEAEIHTLQRTLQLSKPSKE